jgi:hypothetical protein
MISRFKAVCSPLDGSGIDRLVRRNVSPKSWDGACGRAFYKEGVAASSSRILEEKARCFRQHFPVLCIFMLLKCLGSVQPCRAAAGPAVSADDTNMALFYERTDA